MKKFTSPISTLQWSPIKYLSREITENVGVIILNRPIKGCANDIIRLWQQAIIRVTVDGGTDRWMSYIKQNEIDCKLNPPDIITGDMDSIQEHTKEYFINLGVDVINTPDQSETDFTKCLREISNKTKANNVKLDAIVTLAETSGRLDQIMSNINTLFKAKDILPGTNIFMMSSASLSWLLPPGSHIIDIPDKLVTAKAWCALIPIGTKCRSITTTGLKWNLKEGTMEFGGMVSTSNTYDGSSVVTIINSDPIIWAMSTKNLRNL